MMIAIKSKTLAPLKLVQPDGSLGAGYIHLEAKEKCLTATRKNRQEALLLKLAVDSEECWQATLPPVLLEVLDVAGEEVEIKQKEPGVELTSGGFSAHVLGISSDDYDFSYQAVEGSSLEISSSELKKALEAVSFAAGNSSYFNPAYNSILLADYAVATNGYQMAFYKLSVEFPNLTLPLQSAKHVARLLGDEGWVTVTWDQGNVQFATENMTYQSRLYDMPFPNWKKIIPGETRADLILGKKETLEALKALRGLEAKGIHITVKSGTAIFEAEGQNGKGQVAMPVKGDTEKEWMISQEYLANVLGPVGETIEVQVVGQTLFVWQEQYRAAVALMKKG